MTLPKFTLPARKLRDSKIENDSDRQQENNRTQNMENSERQKYKLGLNYCLVNLISFLLDIGPDVSNNPLGLRLIDVTYLCLLGQRKC